MSQDISFKRINKLAIPALIAGVAEPLLSTTDLAIVGNINYNATESIAAIGIVGAFLSMLIWVFGQTRSGISSIISQYIGADKLNEVKNTLINSNKNVAVILFIIVILKFILDVGDSSCLQTITTYRLFFICHHNLLNLFSFDRNISHQIYIYLLSNHYIVF